MACLWKHHEQLFRAIWSNVKICKEQFSKKTCWTFFQSRCLEELALLLFASIKDLDLDMFINSLNQLDWCTAIAEETEGLSILRIESDWELSILSIFSVGLGWFGARFAQFNSAFSCSSTDVAEISTMPFLRLSMLSFDMALQPTDNPVLVYTWAKMPQSEVSIAGGLQ